MVVVCEDENVVCMAVHNAAGRDEGVQQRFNGGTRRGWLHQRVGEILHHLFVAHIFPLQEGKHVVHAHAWEVPSRHSFEIGAAPFHAQHVCRLAHEIMLTYLERSVASAPQHKGRVRAEQTRLVNQQVEVRHAGRFAVAPAVLYRSIEFIMHGLPLLIRWFLYFAILHIIVLCSCERER